MSGSEELKDSERIMYRYWDKAHSDDETGTETGRYPLVSAATVASPDR